jgi:hypothetical protein
VVKLEGKTSLQEEAREEGVSCRFRCWADSIWSVRVSGSIRT